MLQRITIHTTVRFYMSKYSKFMIFRIHIWYPFPLYFIHLKNLSLLDQFCIINLQQKTGLLVCLVFLKHTEEPIQEINLDRHILNSLQIMLRQFIHLLK